VVIAARECKEITRRKARTGVTENREDGAAESDVEAARGHEVVDEWSLSAERDEAGAMP
jgi:hypothetical protein